MAVDPASERSSPVSIWRICQRSIHLMGLIRAGPVWELQVTTIKTIGCLGDDLLKSQVIRVILKQIHTSHATV